MNAPFVAFRFKALIQICLISVFVSSLCFIIAENAMAIAKTQTDVLMDESNDLAKTKRRKLIFPSPFLPSASF